MVISFVLFQKPMSRIATDTEVNFIKFKNYMLP